jgi:hypothetical protein
MGIYNWLKKRKIKSVGNSEDLPYIPIEDQSPGTEPKRKRLFNEERVRKRLEKSEYRPGRDFIGLINLMFLRNYGIGFKNNEMPYVHVTPLITSLASFDSTDNIPGMEFKNKKILSDGNAVGEEFGHSLRHKYLDKQQPGEKLTDEFFGYLGRRLFYDTLGDKDKQAYFKQGIPVRSNNDDVKELRRLRKEYLWETSGIDVSEAHILVSNHEAMNRFHKNLPLLYGDIARIENQRRDILTHSRGYRFASQVDLSQIKDWEKLFSMPDKEVRKRFFRDNPDYSGLDGFKHGPYNGSADTAKHQAGLEQAVSTAFFMMLPVMLFYFLFNIRLTGSVIGESPILTGFLGIILGFLTLCFAWFKVKKRRSKKK